MRGANVQQGANTRVRRLFGQRLVGTRLCVRTLPPSFSLLTLSFLSLSLSLSLSLALLRTVRIFVARTITIQQRTRTPFGGSVPRFSPSRRLKNRTVIYGIALDGGISLMGCLNVSILSLILLSAPAFDPRFQRFRGVEPWVTIVKRGYFSASG